MACRFIKQEAEEKAAEIGVAAEEEFNITKLQVGVHAGARHAAARGRGAVPPLGQPPASETGQRCAATGNFRCRPARCSGNGPQCAVACASSVF